MSLSARGDPQGAAKDALLKPPKTVTNFIFPGNDATSIPIVLSPKKPLRRHNWKRKMWAANLGNLNRRYDIREKLFRSAILFLNPFNAVGWVLFNIAQYAGDNPQPPESLSSGKCAASKANTYRKKNTHIKGTRMSHLNKVIFCGRLFFALWVANV